MTDQAQQFDLFSEIAKAATRMLEEKPPAQRHSDTSRAAAESIAVVAGTLRHQVLAFIAECLDGATDELIQKGLGMAPNTERPRRIELLHAGLIWDRGTRHPTDSGRRAVAWTVTHAGRQALVASRRTP
jgi:hypothetical protein